MKSILRRIVLLMTVLLSVVLAACGGSGDGGDGKNIGNVVGTVTDSTTGESVADADISIGDKTGVADSAGVFTILDIPEGSQSITVSKSGYKTYSDMLSVEKDTTITYDVSLLGIGNVVGTVTDSTTGEGVADVNISIGDKTSVTDSAGVFTILDIPEGSQSITVSKSSYKTYNDTVSVEKDTTITYDVSLLGPVAYYPFNGNANDESGNGNDGIVSGATLTMDRFGNPSSAYNFNGSGDYIKILQSETLNNLQTTTISYWVKYYKPTSGSKNVSVTITNGSDKPAPFVDGFFTYAGKDGIGHYLGKWADNVGVMVPIDATIPYEKQEFVFVTFVADVDTIKSYKNGVLIEQVARENRNISRPDEDWFIGTNGNVNLPYYLNGVMDDIRIYNFVLSESEIQMLYNSGN